MLNWRRISTEEVPGLTEKFKSIRISPFTSKYYKKELDIFVSLRRRVFLSVGRVLMGMCFQFAGVLPFKLFELLDTP